MSGATTIAGFVQRAFAMLVTWIVTTNLGPWKADTFAMLFTPNILMAPTFGYVERVSSEFKHPFAGR
jgi:hypothetical protein